MKTSSDYRALLNLLIKAEHNGEKLKNNALAGFSHTYNPDHTDCQECKDHWAMIVKDSQ